MRWKHWLVLFFLVFFAWSCQKLPYIPDENAVIYLEASPAVMDAGESSLISIRGEKGNGYPLPDGTIVYLSVSRGEISGEAILQNGRATVEYRSAENFSGDVEIRARSGQSAIIPESLVITIADHEISSLMIRADPAELPYGGGESVIDVVAYDEHQQSVTGKIVFLAASQGTLSGGGSRMTDNEGAVQAILYTENEAVVTATYKNLSATVTVRIADQNTKPVADFIHSPVEPKSGETIYFNATASYDDDGRIVSYQWDFGDGITGKGENVSHVYTVSAARRFTVVLKVIDDDGAKGVKSKEIAIQAAG